MPNLPVRDLAKLGIVRDTAPWDSPEQAWSAGTNVRFEDGKAMRAPIFRTGIAAGASGLADMVSIGSFTAVSGTDTIFVFDTMGRAYQFTPGTGLTNVTEVSFTLTSGDTQFTTCYLGGVFYVNRETHAPRYFGPSSSKFAPLPNMDTPSWTCGVLRAFRDFLVAFNVTKTGTPYPNLVKWSDATLYGSCPGSWDTTVTTNLAGENPLAQADSGIVDANNLRDAMIIYTRRQIWIMEYTGDKTFPMTFHKLWQDDRWGAMSRNCSIEVDGLHYVFGQQDIYVHDGVGMPRSLVDGRVRNDVYSSMTIAAAKYCHVVHDPYAHEVLFCYQSQSDDTVFTGVTYCNKAVVFNYRSNTLAYREMPNTRAGTVASASTVKTWAVETSTWGTSGGSWAAQADNMKSALLVCGNTLSGVLTDARVYVVDPVFRGSRISLPADPEANTAPYLEHGGMDLDGAQLPLQNFKWVRNVYPQARLAFGGPLTISIGAAALTNQLPNYVSVEAYDPNTDYNINSRASGRYVALRVDAPALTDFDFTGYDLEVIGGGKR
jgi:hypothetical protein